MRKIYTTLICLTAAGMSFGQVTLNGTDVNPTLGESFDYTQSTFVAPGSGGAGQTWDLSSATPGTAGVVNFNAANGSFPQTNFTQEDPAGGSLYQDMSNSGIYIWGMNAGGTVITYSNAMTYLEYPLSMGTNGTDSHVATFMSGGYSFTRAGNTTWDTDGYGTVITPNGTYTDVVRVHMTQIYTDTYSLGTIDYDVEIYAWYKAGIHYPVASMTTLTTFQGTQEYGTYLTGNVGLEEATAANLTVYPNPATDVINVLTDQEVAELTITDISGKVVKTATGNNVNIEDLNAGVYFVTTLSKEGVRSQASKIIKQ